MLRLAGLCGPQRCPHGPLTAEVRLSAAVPVNIDVDLQLTLIGSALYRMLANRLPPPFAKNKARTLFRNFVDVPARITITPDQIIIRLKRRTHNSVLREAG